MTGNIKSSIAHVQHGLIMAILAILLGTSWVVYIATHHEQLHGGFEEQEAQLKQTQMQHLMQDMNMDDMNSIHDHGTAAPAGHSHGITDGGSHHHAAGHQHSHSGSLAKDAMQRLLRGHIHFMGIGTLIAVLLLIVAFSSLKPCWKKTLAWSFGLGALAYPPAWIIMGFRTVAMGPEAAEASIMWLFGPAVALLLASIISLLCVLIIEAMQWHEKKLFLFLFSVQR